MEGLVTVGIPTVGRAAHLRKALDSLLDQSFTSWICLVADDTASDAIQSLVESFRDSRLHYVGHQERLGLAANFNFILESATTELCCILHDDDWYHPDYLSTMVSAMREHPDARWAFCNAWRVDEDGGETRLWVNDTQPQVFPRSGYLLSRLARENCICCPTVMLHREVYSSNRFSPSLTMTVDWDLWLRLSRSYDALFVASPLLYHRRWTGNTSRDCIRALLDLKEAVAIYTMLADVPELGDLRLELLQRRRQAVSRLCRRLMALPAGAGMTHDIQSLDGQPGLVVPLTRFVLGHPAARIVAAALLRCKVKGRCKRPGETKDSVFGKL